MPERMDAERMRLMQNENELFFSLLIQCLGYQIKTKPWFETPLEDQFLIGCELLLMMEGYLFWCYIYGGKWRSNFIQAVTYSRACRRNQVAVFPDYGIHRWSGACRVRRLMSRLTQDSVLFMLLLAFYTDSFHLRTGVFCHVYSKERLDLPWISSVQCVWRIDNWLALDSFPFSPGPDF